MADCSNFFAFLIVCTLIVFCDAQKPAEDDDKNKVVTYAYGYDVGSHYHNEAKDSKNVVRGEYGWMGPDGIYREYNYTADKYGFRINRRRSRVRDRYTPPTAVPGQQPTARAPAQTTPQTLAGRTGIPVGSFRPYVIGTPRSPSGDDDSRPSGQATTTLKASASDNLLSSTVEPGGTQEEQLPYGMDGGAGPAEQGSSSENGIEAHASEQANTTLLGPSSSGNGNSGFASAISQSKGGTTEAKTEVDKTRSSASARAEGSVSSSQAAASMNHGESSSSSYSSASASSKVAGDGLTLSSAQATGSASTLGIGSGGSVAGDSGYGNPEGSASATGASGSDNSGFGVPGASRTSGSRGPGTASSAKTLLDRNSRPAGNHPTVSTILQTPTTRRPFMLPYPPIVYNFSRSSGPGIAARKPSPLVTNYPPKPAPGVVVPPAEEYRPKSYGPTFPESPDTTASQTCTVPSFPTDQKPSGISREEQQTPDGKLIGKYKLTFPMGYVLEIAYTAYQDPSLAASDSHDDHHTGSKSCK